MSLRESAGGVHQPYPTNLDRHRHESISFPEVVQSRPSANVSGRGAYNHRSPSVQGSGWLYPTLAQCYLSFAPYGLWFVGLSEIPSSDAFA